MADEENDTGSAETDALLADLERRASEGGASKSGAETEGDDEDLEAFLASLEDDDVDTTSESKSADPDPLAAEFAELEKTAPPAPEASSDKADKSGKDDKKEKKKVKAVEKGESDGLKKVAAVMRWSFYILPTFVAIWVLGAVLSNWVSAAWLVLLMSFITIFGLSAALRLGIRKGSYGIWLGSLATLVTVGFLAGMTAWSGASLAKFGHWPTSAVAEAAGWPADHGAVAANAWMGEVIGGQLSKLRNSEPQQAYRLGGTLLLSGEEPGISTEDATAKEDPPAEKSDAAEPVESTKDSVQEEPRRPAKEDQSGSEDPADSAPEKDEAAENPPEAGEGDKAEPQDEKAEPANKGDAEGSSKPAPEKSQKDPAESADAVDDTPEPDESPSTD